MAAPTLAAPAGVQVEIKQNIPPPPAALPSESSPPVIDEDVLAANTKANARFTRKSITALTTGVVIEDSPPPKPHRQFEASGEVLPAPPPKPKRLSGNSSHAA